MGAPIRDLPPILQGSTWEVIIRWESDVLAYKAIQGITQATPGVVTTTADHEIPPNWQVAIVGAKGMRQVNSKRDPPSLGDFWTARVTGLKTLELPISTSGFPAYSGGGSIVYRVPKDLTGYSARMQLRSAIESTGTPLLELTSTGGKILIDETDFKITLTLTAAETALLEFDSAVYDLEMVSDDLEPVVTRILQGRVSLDREVTRT